jgi:hypothetical protein
MNEVIEFELKMARIQLICCYVTIAGLVGLLILEKLK